MHELFAVARVLIPSLALLGWIILRAVEWSSEQDFKAIERAMKNEPQRKKTQCMNEFLQRFYFGMVARSHRAQLFRVRGAEEWCVARETRSGTIFGFGSTPFEAWHDYEYSRLTGEK